MSRFERRTPIVTGASRGIGLGIAKQLVVLAVDGGVTAATGSI